jgi:NAD(P)-dependent dehydrogenase (short-subunit alcohol dehydrogenase family)
VDRTDSLTRTDPVVVVSGATGGIGQAVVRQLACDGAIVALLGRSPQRLEQTCRDLCAADPELAGRLVPYAVDINDAADTDDVIQAVVRDHQGVDAFVHAAGDGPVAPLREADDLMWHTTWNAKLMGAVRLTRALAGPMAARGGGRIVFVAGAFRQTPHPMFPVNSAVNAALAAFAKSASQDLGGDGIHVNVVDPGAVETPLWAQTAKELARRTGTTAAGVDAGIAAATPLGALTSPQDVAATVAFLLSPAARHLTGTAITVDGGACPAL